MQIPFILFFSKYQLNFNFAFNPKVQKKIQPKLDNFIEFASFSCMPF